MFYGNESFAPTLLTDYYQLTMAYASWKAGVMEVPAMFSLYFRSNPFRGGYSVLAGLEPAFQFLERLSFGETEATFIGSLKNTKGKPLFEKKFVEFLRASRFSWDVDAIAEGSVVFAHEPCIRVKGPLWQCQWVESALLNLVNFQTLIATKAARIVQAARGAEVVEFGLRRAQGIDGALSASRAAYIGGVVGTSNLEASRLYGIPLRGTHAHSWVMAFDSELDAFEKYAEAFPDQCLLLVDTYETLEGIRHALQVGLRLKAKGHRLAGIRLDSGDFAYLSEQARKMLDAAGLSYVKIVASNELDEYLIQSLHLQEAKIDMWGIGTKLVTAYDQPAMNGVFKLSAIWEKGAWKPKVKVSDQIAKTSNPGTQRVRRYLNEAGFMEGDLIYDESENPSKIDRILDPVSTPRSKRLLPEWSHRELLEPCFREGRRVSSASGLEEARTRARENLGRLHPGHKRLENPHAYPVGLSPFLSQLKAKLIQTKLGHESQAET